MQQTCISQSTIENSPGQAAKNHEDNKDSKSNPQEDKKKKNNSFAIYCSSNVHFCFVFCLILEGNVDNMKLEDILIFASGASKVPLAGFQGTPTITFLEPGLGQSLPTANTCSVSLNLPMCSTFNDFSEGMALAIACAKTFGIA